jgi:hypothetical protein
VVAAEQRIRRAVVGIADYLRNEEEAAAEMLRPFCFGGGSRDKLTEGGLSDTNPGETASS